MTTFTVKLHVGVYRTPDGGWETNDMRTAGTIDVPKDKSYDTRTIFKALREQLDLTVDSRKVCIPNSPYCAGHLDVEYRRSGKPVAFLERHQET